MSFPDAVDGPPPALACDPKQHSSGGKEKLGSISKQDDRSLRSLFTSGAL
jgi:transposase